MQKGGCAAKVAATELRKILGGLRFPPASERLLVDGAHFDDAAIYKISPDLALVQTLDFFTPIVDTPSIFGQIACANALSDVYAMGGLPQTAMAILAFPLATLPSSLATEVLQGACDILQQADTCLAGGHSIDDDTLKFGLSVTGFVHPEKVWSNTKARPGDVLILTKPLGTGAATAALKRQEVQESDLAEVLSSMTQLNATQDILAEKLFGAIHAATDITGFGLLGHALQMARASQVSFSLEMKEIPTFEIAKWAIQKGFLTKAHRTNQAYVQEEVASRTQNETDSLLLVDPQTSGGLLLSVGPEQAEILLQNLRKRFARAAIIGRVSSPLENRPSKNWPLENRIMVN